MIKNKKGVLPLVGLMSVALAISALIGANSSKFAYASGETKADLAAAVSDYILTKDVSSLSSRDIDALTTVGTMAVDKGSAVFDSAGYADALNAAKEVVDKAPMFANLKDYGTPYTIVDFRTDRQISGGYGNGDGVGNNVAAVSKISDTNYSMAVSAYYKNNEITTYTYDAMMTLRAGGNISNDDAELGYDFAFKNNDGSSDKIFVRANNSLVATYDVDLDVTKAHLVEMFAVDYADNDDVCVYLYLDDVFQGYVATSAKSNNAQVRHRVNNLQHGDPYCRTFGSVYTGNVSNYDLDITGVNPSSSSSTLILQASTNDIPVTGNSDEHDAFYPLGDNTIEFDGVPFALKLQRGFRAFYKTTDTDYQFNLGGFNNVGLSNGSSVTLRGKFVRSVGGDSKKSYLVNVPETTYLYLDDEGYVLVSKDNFADIAAKLLSFSNLDEIGAMYADIIHSTISKTIEKVDNGGSIANAINTVRDAIGNVYHIGKDANVCAPSKTMGDLRGKDQGRVISNASGPGDSTNNASIITRVDDNNYSQHVRVNYYNSSVHNTSQFGNFDARYTLRGTGNDGYGFTFDNDTEETAIIGIQVNNVTEATYHIDLPTKVVHLVEMFAVNSKDNAKVYCMIVIDGCYVGSIETNEVINVDKATHQLNPTASEDAHGQQFVGFGTYYENCEDVGEIAFKDVADYGTSNQYTFYIEAESENNLPLTENITAQGNEVNVYGDADANFKINGVALGMRYIRSGGSLSKVSSTVYKVCIDKFALAGNKAEIGQRTGLDAGDILEISGSYNFSDIVGEFKTYTFSVPSIFFEYKGDGSWVRYKTLEDLVAEAKAEIEAYKAEEITDYELDVSSEKETAYTTLDTTTDKDLIVDIVDAYKNAVDAKIAQASLAIYKDNAKAELEGYADLSLYREAEQQTINDLVAQGKQSIDLATTESGVDNIVAAIKAQIDALKTAAEYEAEENSSVTSEVSSVETSSQGEVSSKEETSSSSQDEPAKGGCGGSIIATSALISLLSVAGLVLVKRRKQN